MDGNKLPVVRSQQSFSEEIANSISHGAGALAAFVGAPFVILSAVHRGPAAGIVGAAIFAFTTLLLYTISTIYHALPNNRAKAVFQILDHSAIFLLIAGTYTPFTLGVLQGPWGWTLFGLVWGLAFFGVIFKSVMRVRYLWVSTALYLIMGWLIVIAFKPLLLYLPTSGLLWLLAGGVFYTIGVIFFAVDEKIRYCHFVWHLFVLAGTTCHFFAVLYYSA